LNDEEKRKEALKYDLDLISNRDIITIILGKLTLGTASKARKWIVFFIVMMLSCFQGLNYYFKETATYVAIPGTIINASVFSKIDDGVNPVNALSVKYFKADSLVKQLYLWATYWGEYKYIEPVDPFDGVFIDTKMSIGGDMFDMQMSAYLAVNKYLGTPKEYTQEVTVSSIGTSTTGTPILLPSDVILKVDGVQVTDSMDIWELQLEPIMRTVTVRRGSEVIDLRTTLLGLEVTRSIFLKNTADYDGFYAFANLSVKGYSGRSAGAALALEHYNTSVKDILKGRRVAMTGTISPTGEVGHISGIQQKTVLALKNKVEIMFTPVDDKVANNYTDAKAVIDDLHEGMTLVAVHSFADIIDYLNK
jgi:PDZ domain-containing secreted protein